MPILKIFQCNGFVKGQAGRFNLLLLLKSYILILLLTCLDLILSQSERRSRSSKFTGEARGFCEIYTLKGILVYYCSEKQSSCLVGFGFVWGLVFVVLGFFVCLFFNRSAFL